MQTDGVNQGAPTPESNLYASEPMSLENSGDKQGDARTHAEAISWTASEYADHAKGFGWFAGLFLVIVGLSVATYFLSGDIIVVIMLVLAGLSFGIFGARKPRVLHYGVDHNGIKIDQKLFPYSELRSFAVLDDGPLPTLMILPLKRFMPPISLFFDPEQGDAIIDTLSQYLPHEDHELDLIDRLMSHIRF